MPKIALITGANKGIGFAAAHQIATAGFHVIIAARDAQRGEDAAQKLRSEGLSAESVLLDVTDAASIQATAQTVSEKHGVLDVLVNNAAVALDGETDLLSVSADTFRQTYESNVFGPLQVTQKLWALLLKSESPRVVNVSSGLGRLYDMENSMASYASSKTALNALTRQFAGLGKGKVAVNSICPGWVRTDMGGENAERTPDQGAAIITKLATMENPPTGQYLNDEGEIGW
jgi:NAD(P)-dependent dehydrogenase (short-subunit alcohol dehydrogenase family)